MYLTGRLIWTVIELGGFNGRTKAAENMSGNHVPDYHLAVVAGRRQKIRRTVSNRHDVVRVTATLSTTSLLSPDV